MTEKNNPLKHQFSKKIEAKYDFDVKTMPQKFLSLRSSSGKSFKIKGAKRSLMIGIIVIITAGCLMMLAAWLFLRSINKKQDIATAIPAKTEAVSNKEESSLNTATTTVESNEPSVDEASLVDVAKWTIFSDEIHGYRLKYPSTWTNFIDNSLESWPGALKVIVLSSASNGHDVTIVIYQSSSDVTLPDWLQKNTVHSEDGESFVLNNQQGQKYADDAGGFIIYASFLDKIYAIMVDQSVSDLYATVDNQIISNFEFIANASYLENQDEYVASRVPGSDLDNDGLSDLEEDLFITDKNNPDTDGDGFNDGVEVENVYDPAISGTAKLFGSSLMATYINNSYKYNLLYPRAWEKKENNGNIYFYAPDKEFIGLQIESNTDGYADIDEWYEAQFGIGSRGEELMIDNIRALRSQDKLGVYFMFGDHIYSFVYNTSLREDINYFAILKMMVASFKFMS